MFWQTLWALVLGFTVSGAVQAFVSRARMQRALGDHRPMTIAKAGLYGAASSSCSYAASALAKTLFARGADFTAAQAFMFASTNLVIELGAVLWLLIGWQFAAAEFVGGALMIVLLALVLPRLVTPGDVSAARRRLAEIAPTTPDAPSDPTWSDAARYTIGDLTMVRREIVIGFVVAGFADAAVPISFWRSLFASGHGFWSVLENVALGPLLAIISFVCSIGNVPLAAALWSGGIAFGGVIAFVFADLITLPLLFMYRKYYGTRLTLKLLGGFWATMSIAGLAVQYLFRALRIAPRDGAARHGMIGDATFGLNYTTALDVVAIAVLAVLFWLAHHGDPSGAGTSYAKDPVCGMQVDKQHAGATSTDGDGQLVYFCSDHCRDRFAAGASQRGT